MRLLDVLLEAARLIQIGPYPRVFERLVAQAADLLALQLARSGWSRVMKSFFRRRPRARATVTGYSCVRSLTGLAILQRAPVTSEDLRTDHRFYRADLAESQAWTRALIVPLLTSAEGTSVGQNGPGGSAIGAFSVYGVGVERGSFAESEWDKKVLTCLAHYAALAYQNAVHQRALRAAEERHAVAETFAAVGDVAANVLHHLNNKVGTIPVRVQAIQDKCAPSLAGDAYLASNIAEIERSAREAMDAVRESLIYLRPIHASPVDVAGCVGAALASLHPPDAVRIELSDLEVLPPVNASQRSLTFVFTNLLENAMVAMQGQGTITIRGRADETWVELVVEDDGPGIPAEMQERIFEFAPAGQAPGRNGNLGFGLWWVKTLMTRLGGTVRVESDGHRGTRFRLSLPRVGAGYAG